MRKRASEIVREKRITDEENRWWEVSFTRNIWLSSHNSVQSCVPVCLCVCETERKGRAANKCIRKFIFRKNKIFSHEVNTLFRFNFFPNVVNTTERERAQFSPSHMFCTINNSLPLYSFQYHTHTHCGHCIYYAWKIFPKVAAFTSRMQTLYKIYYRNCFKGIFGTTLN